MALLPADKLSENDKRALSTTAIVLAIISAAAVVLSMVRR